MGEIWKYRQNKKYRFRIEFDIFIRTSETIKTKSITFEQGFITFLFDSRESPASLIAITPDTQYGFIYVWILGTIL